MKKRVLFVCTRNSARSQMAEGLLRHIYGDKYEVFSAGINPGEVNPNSIEVLKEIGIDISNHRSKSVDEFIQDEFDLVVTVCGGAKKMCPHFSGGKKQIHKGFEDPDEADGSMDEILESFRQTRDLIKAWIEDYFKNSDDLGGQDKFLINLA